MKLVISIITFCTLMKPLFSMENGKVNKIKPKNVTCSFLQNKIYNEKALYIKYRVGIIQNKVMTYSEDVAFDRCEEFSNIDGQQKIIKAVVKTKDVQECYIGYFCKFYPSIW